MRLFGRMIRTSLTFLFAVVFVVYYATDVVAQTPSISATSPQGAKPGETLDVKLRGANLSSATQLWTSFQSDSSLPSDVQGNGTKADEVVYRVKLPENVPLGVHGLRVVTAQGVSNLKLFVVDDLPSVAQVRPNQSTSAAQSVTLPIAVDGSVESLARDYYKFTVAAGQRVSFEVLARRIGSALDSMIRILDVKGRELAYSDDALGLGPDSQLTYTFKDAGEYLLELRDIRYQGGGNFVYRLRMGDFPSVTAPYPMAIKRGVASQVAFAGSSAQDAQSLPINLPSEAPLNWLPVAAKVPGGKSSGFALLAVGAQDEILEAEPNNEQAQAAKIVLGANINGRIDQPGDVDRYTFTAKANDRYVFTGVTRSQGAPTDLYVRLLKSDGAEVAAAEDSGTNEGAIDYKFPADGDYTLVVEDLHRRGGTEFAYRIAVKPYEEKFALSASTDTLNIPKGGLAAITVTATRSGFTGPIALSLVDPPAGIVVAPTFIAPGRNLAVMTVQCTDAAAAGKLHLLKILGTSRKGNEDVTAIATLADAQKASFNGLPWPPPSLSDSVAVAVAPPPLFTLKTDPAEVTLVKGKTATFKIVANRLGDFKEDITIAIEPAKDGLPTGVTAAVKPIAKGSNEIAITLTATAAAPAGESTAVFLGTGKKDSKTSIQPIPALKLTITADEAKK